MSIYFSYFPTVQHDLTNNGQYVTLTNVMRRFKINSKTKNATGVYYEYDIQAGDRPDTIANKYYGDSVYAWVVLHYNDIIDPVFGWPLFNVDFDNYIKSKYGSVQAAQSEIHEYRKITTQQQTKVDGTIISEKYLVVDKVAYDATAPTSRRTIYKYDWELELNEAKKRIRLLDKKYLPQIVDEVEEVLRNGV
jgi:hypothetical protein